MKAKNLISISDLTKEDILEIFSTAKLLKKKQKEGDKYTPLKRKTLAMIFAKPSTRTRVSFEAGMFQLGGLAFFLSGQDLQLGRGETIADTARTLSRYVNGIMIRTFKHKDAEDLVKYATIPIINGLTDLEHPCQALGDIFTIIEKKCQKSEVILSGAKNLKFVYIGDGNNVTNSLMLLCAKLSIPFTAITPKGYEPDKNICTSALEISKTAAAKLIFSNDPGDIKDSDIVYTDVWASMGKESEREKRAGIFKAYQVNSSLLSKAKSDCIVMHCLPAKRGEEITDEVIDSKNSVVFDQAENRLHIQKAIMLLLMS